MGALLTEEDKTNLKELGQAIKKARMQMHLAQEELAEITGIDRHTIGRVENAKCNPRCNTILRLLKRLRIPQSDLFYEGADGRMPNADAVLVELEKFGHEELDRLENLVRILQVFLRSHD